MLISKKKHVGRASKNQNDILEQELTNIILSKISLKQLQGDSKRYCQNGTTWKTYSKQLILDSLLHEFPFGEIEKISEVGVVQKVDKKYCKDLVDRLLGYLPKNDS